ncbi:MAG: hypothetical protein PUK81_08285, partial [Firmicutes bacterium]|nr:hypothetical protein [Bacillota bacterium]
QLKIPEKPRKIKGFRSGSYRIATTISSQPRYDRFDTSPDVGAFSSCDYYSRVPEKINHFFFAGEINRGGG